jgi:hypothetical protein
MAEKKVVFATDEPVATTLVNDEITGMNAGRVMTADFVSALVNKGGNVLDQYGVALAQTPEMAVSLNSVLDETTGKYVKPEESDETVNYEVRYDGRTNFALVSRTLNSTYTISLHVAVGTVDADVTLTGITFVSTYGYEEAVFNPSAHDWYEADVALVKSQDTSVNPTKEYYGDEQYGDAVVSPKAEGWQEVTGYNTWGQPSYGASNDTFMKTDKQYYKQSGSGQQATHVPVYAEDASPKANDWYEETTVYVKTADTARVDGKSYYKESGSPVDPVNPYAEGWYELTANNTYVLTADTTEQGKTYYTRGLF